MPRTRHFRTLLLLALAAVPMLPACSSSDEPHAQPDPSASVVLEGDASQAQLEIFLQHEARDWAWAGGQFDTPKNHATLAADTPQTFAWHADPADFAEGDASGDPVMTHLLVFSTPSNSSVLEVFTTLPEYTPDASAWKKLVDAGEPIKVSLTTGTFVGSDLPEDGGPFIGQTLTLTIE